MTLFPIAIHLHFPLILVGYTSLYKLYYHSSLLQGERQACFAACYAAQHSELCLGYPKVTCSLREILEDLVFETLYGILGSFLLLFC